MVRGGSGHPTTGPETAYCIMKAVANVGNQGLDEHRSARILSPYLKNSICKGLSWGTFIQNYETVMANWIRLTDQIAALDIT